ncbi:MAG: hypothetical protein ACK5SZ_01445, partial [bacterium]
MKHIGRSHARALPSIVREFTPFQVEAPFKPTGDQPAAIAQLTQELKSGARASCLLGATGTG